MPALKPSPDSQAIELLQSHSLTTLVQREIERMILAGNLASGDKLNEAEIAIRLGVSRGPVREAFRALEEAGLVRTEKNRGVFVRAAASTPASSTLCATETSGSNVRANTATRPPAPPPPPPAPVPPVPPLPPLAWI